MQKRPIILRSLLIVATPYDNKCACLCVCVREKERERARESMCACELLRFLCVREGRECVCGRSSHSILFESLVRIEGVQHEVMSHTFIRHGTHMHEAGRTYVLTHSQCESWPQRVCERESA